MKTPLHQFTAGTISLDLVDTVGDRGGAGMERLTSPEQLAEWLTAAGLVPLRARDEATEDRLKAARKLRESIYRCGLAVIAGKPNPTRDAKRINEWAARPPLRPRLTAKGMTLTAAGSIVDAALSTVAADAIDLLGTSESRGRIRLCPGCEMMFVDTSPPGRRRWCSSAAGCGNRAKIRRHRERTASTRHGKR